MPVALDSLSLWRETLAKTTDFTGLPIDSGIFEVVVAINALGVNTTSSCEGHLTHGDAYPWVMIEGKDASSLRERILFLAGQGKRQGADCEHLVKMLKAHDIEEAEKLVPYLTAFYQTQPFEQDRHLILAHFPKGEVFLQPQGAESQKTRFPNERAKKLKIYQDEISAFAKFLKEVLS